MTDQQMRELVRHWVAQCDPNEPLEYGDQRYVAFDEGEPVRGTRQPSCIQALQDSIDVAGPTEPTCQLITGFPGAGKSTELQQLRHRLETDRLEPTHVIYVDFEEYVDRHTPISITDILRVLETR